MFTAEYHGINSFLVGISKLLLDNRVMRISRGEKCWEFPEPILVKIVNPLSRIITIPQRKWNLALPYAESLWLASGRNDLNFIRFYLAKMSQYSDDSEFMRGGYGPRLRYYSSSHLDYKVDYHRCTSQNLDNGLTDQFRYVCECFKKDIYTRRAIITLGDPSKDCFTPDGFLKNTKDLPCTRLLQFSRKASENKLDLTVYMRSNDFFWGATAVNMFNYMFMQEYFAGILGMDIGNYYHFANNLHYYEARHSEMIESIAAIENVSDPQYLYSKSFNSLKKFDNLLIKLRNWEEELRLKRMSQIKEFEDDFFNDWGKVLFNKITKSSVEYANPILNSLRSTSLNGEPSL